MLTPGSVSSPAEHPMLRRQITTVCKETSLCSSEQLEVISLILNTPALREPGEESASAVPLGAPARCLLGNKVFVNLQDSLSLPLFYRDKTHKSDSYSSSIKSFKVSYKHHCCLILEPFLTASLSGTSLIIGSHFSISCPQTMATTLVISYTQTYDTWPCSSALLPSASAFKVHLTVAGIRAYLLS